MIIIEENGLDFFGGGGKWTENEYAISFMEKNGRNIYHVI